MVFNATFNNISVILGEESGILGENMSYVTDKLYHIMLYRVHLVMGTRNLIGNKHRLHR